MAKCNKSRLTLLFESALLVDLLVLGFTQYSSAAGQSAILENLGCCGLLLLLLCR